MKWVNLKIPHFHRWKVVEVGFGEYEQPKGNTIPEKKVIKSLVFIEKCRCGKQRQVDVLVDKAYKLLKENK